MTATASPLTVAPGSVVVVRDEEWLVTSIDNTLDGQLLHVQGLSDRVRGTSASFYDIWALDRRDSPFAQTTVQQNAGRRGGDRVPITIAVIRTCRTGVTARGAEDREEDWKDGT